MEILKSIPVIGYLLRIIVGIATLPKRMDQYIQRIDRLEADTGKLGNSQQELSNSQQELSKSQMALTESLKEELNTLSSHMQELRKQYHYVSGAEYKKQLFLEASTTPLVWGDKRKLHISDKAAVFPSFFNTNSGSITIGDYTFSGSNVSILAGSHDMILTGFLRRDAEMTEGCDITIGNGVWLGSNSTILGPAVIRDNAVIAAGSVVAPGTVVPSGCVYGGVPARELRKLDLADYNDISNEHIQAALVRNYGVLCISGWREKNPANIDGTTYVVHKLTEPAGVILANRSTIRLFTINNSLEKTASIIHVEGKEIDRDYRIESERQFLVIELNAKEAAPEFFSIQSKNSLVSIYLIAPFEPVHDNYCETI